jgi:uncharacterized protein YqjF (DUF2071 family)
MRWTPLFVSRTSHAAQSSIPTTARFTSVWSGSCSCACECSAWRFSDIGWRRGVVFLKEVVPKFAVAAAARGLYNENYTVMPMAHRFEGNRVEYSWRYSGNWNRLALEISGDPSLAAPGSIEEFITEHYWGYTRQRDGGCLEYHVEHVPWRLWQTSRAQLTCAAGKLYGAEFAEALGGAPRSAFLAEGSPVAVYRGVRIA